MKRKVSQLTPHPNNKEIYNDTDITELKTSIEELGLLEGLVINNKNEVLSGNRRLKALKEIGIKEVDVKILDIDTEEEMLYLIHYNKYRIKSSKEILNEIIELRNYYDNKGIKNKYETIGDEIGISKNKVYKLEYINNTNPTLIDYIDKGNLTIHQAYTQIKKDKRENIVINVDEAAATDISKDQYHLYNSNSDNMKEVDSNTINCIITSPPYYNKRNYVDGGGLGNEDSVEEYIDNLVSHLKDCYRVLRYDGSFYLNIGDSYNNYSLQNIPHRVIIKLIDEYGWYLRNTIIWRKTNPLPSGDKTKLTSSYEFIFHLTKSKDYKYNKMRKPLVSNNVSAQPNHINLKGNSNTNNPYIPSTDGMGGITDFIDEDIIETSVANQQNLKKYMVDYHPAPFPQKLLYNPILSSTDEGDVILDPFNGSGNTGVVSLQLNREYIGYDINSKFISLTNQRLKEIIE
jgi:site-specific DNA-methyltransferase (adenine-specific)